jgi:N-acetyl-alpha-D-muramate 1-phosphate uridylyltransferase
MNQRNTHIRTAMILSAGFGKRMRPLTDSTPKPLLKIDGTPLLGHIFDRLAAAGVERAVVNVHYLGEQIRDYLADETRIDITLIEEPEILETGGGVKNAMSDLGTDPFYCINADAFWLNGYEDTLMRLAREWRDERMDGILLLQSTVDGHGYSGMGDFIAEPDGRLRRRPLTEVAPWLFAGVQILHPRLFNDAPDGPFSLNLLYDRALEAERLYGIVHDGEWFHIGTPAGLDEAETFLSDPFPGEKKR